MESPNQQPARTRTAIAVSIVLHLCVLAALALLAHDEPTSAQARFLDVDSTVRITRIVRRAPATRRPPAPIRIAREIPKRADAPRRPAVVPRRSPLAPVPARSHDRMIARATPGLMHVMPALLALTEPATPAPSPPNPPPTPTPTPPPTPTPTPTPTATPTPRVTATPTRPRDFGGLFSQNYPPALSSPAILATIRSRLGGHGHVRIEIDESGHATAIRFTPVPADDATSTDLRAQLLDLTYVPADCNGLPCDGSLDLTY